MSNEKQNWHDAVRQAGGIVHGDGNIFFTNYHQMQEAIRSLERNHEEAMNRGLENDARLTAPKRRHCKDDAEYAEELYDHQLALSAWYYKRLKALEEEVESLRAKIRLL